MRWPRLSTVVASGLGSLALGFGFLGASAAGAPADEPGWTPGQKAHWAYVAPVRPDLPAVKAKGWVRNPVDAFILAEQESVGLVPAPEADKATLIRRLTFDLTGLPPTPLEVEAFLNDDRPDAYERLVDRLLDSERYGERWARVWLDLARFAESDGFKSDKTRPSAWRYRDWVIHALNRDLPYDRFVALQLAGDEIDPLDTEAFVATGFNRNYPFEDNNNVPGLNEHLMLEDMTDTTTSVFLGMTVACARCHDHKYDPISQKDYFRFKALFAASVPKDDAPLAPPFERAFHASVKAEHDVRLDRFRRERSAIEKPYLAALVKANLDKLPAEARKAFETDPQARSAHQEDLLRRYAKETTVEPAVMGRAMSPADRRSWAGLGSEMERVARDKPEGPPVGSGMTDSGAHAPPTRLLFKGNYANPADEVGPGFPSVFDGVLPAFAEGPTSNSTGRRKALAEWLTRPDHPLTARVMVNRLWQQHFGRGIVATPSDFGTQGTAPSHPALLDWLATEFVARGWGLKTMHRLLVSSATYRQSSTPEPQARDDDPENSLFTRMTRRRLEGEAVRDALLAVSGRLDERVGGPSVFPELPPGVQTRGGWTVSTAEADRNRRSVYVFVRRNLKYPMFDAFDSPDTNTTCPERNVTVNAPQALMLLNSGLVLGEARSFAGRLLATADDRNDPAALVTAAYRLAFGRVPTPDELSKGSAFLQDQPGLLSARADDPKALDLPEPMPDSYGPARGAALVDYCHVLLNLNEFVFVD